MLHQHKIIHSGKFRSVTLATLSALVMFEPIAALAAGNSDRIKPATGLLDDLTSGLIQIGIPVVGLGIVALGIWGGVSGRIDWNRVGMIFVAGLFVTVGPMIITSLLGS